MAAGTQEDSFSYPEAPYFEDVPPSDPFFKFVQKFRELNITLGCMATRFCPDGPVLREQMAAFIMRAKYGSSFSSAPAPYFTDVPNTNSFFPFIQKMRETGITLGCTATQYCPGSPTTREQMAAFLIRGFFTMW